MKIYAYLNISLFRSSFQVFKNKFQHLACNHLIIYQLKTSKKKGRIITLDHIDLVNLMNSQF